MAWAGLGWAGLRLKPGLGSMSDEWQRGSLYVTSNTKRGINLGNIPKGRTCTGVTESSIWQTLVRTDK
jgi:hypothetical protein